MMKAGILYFLFALLLTGFSGQISEKITTEKINGILCKNNDAWLPYLYRGSSRAWIPTNEQVIATEAMLETYLKATPHSEFVMWKKADRLKLWERLAQYKRQYYGFTRKGNEMIYGNFYCDETPLSCNPVDVQDGGDCYLQIVFDMNAKKVKLFHRNGKA